MRPLLAYFALAYGISWLIWAPLWLPHFGITGLPVLPYHHGLGGLGPMLAAFILTARQQGWAGVGQLLQRMVQWRGAGWALGYAALGPFVLLGLAALLYAVVDGGSVVWAGLGRGREFPELSILGFALYNLIFFGWGEEVGWRGYALPRLLVRHRWLAATAVLTLGWALWHLPTFFYRTGYMTMDVPSIIGWVLSLFTGALILTWLYRLGQGSLLVCAVFHCSIDIVFMHVQGNAHLTNYLGMLVTLWGLGVAVLLGVVARNK